MSLRKQLYFSPLFIILLILVAGTIHEVGHYIFLKILGFEAYDFRSDLLSGRIFMFSHTPINDPLALMVVRYAGGLFSALVMSFVYFKRKEFFNRNMIFGVSIFLFIGMHVSQAILEGSFNDDYFSSNILGGTLTFNIIMILGMFSGPIIFLYSKKKKP